MSSSENILTKRYVRTAGLLTAAAAVGLSGILASAPAYADPTAITPDQPGGLSVMFSHSPQAPGSEYVNPTIYGVAKTPPDGDPGRHAGPYDKIYLQDNTTNDPKTWRNTFGIKSTDQPDDRFTDPHPRDDNMFYRVCVSDERVWSEDEVRCSPWIRPKDHYR